MRNINYCCSCSLYTATLYIELGLIFTGLPASRSHLQACALEGVNNKSTAKFGSRVICNLLAERCLKLY